MDAENRRLWLGCLVAGAMLLGAVPWGEISPATAEPDRGTNEAEKEEVDPRAALNKANSLASRNALTLSVPHYEKAIRHGFRRLPSAHFNLAEVLKAKEDWDRAILHYGAYLNLGDDPETRAKAKRGLDSVKARIWNKKLAKLSVDVEPTKGATVYVEGFPVETGENLEKMTLLAGTYEVRVEVTDHEPATKTVKLEHEGAETLDFEPTKKTFFGTVRIDVGMPDASVRMVPKNLDAPKAPDDPVETTSPVEEPIRLATGKWLVEVEKEGYHRWVRHVEVKRDKQADVRVQLSEKLPAEIR